MAIEVESQSKREKGKVVKYALYIGVALLLIMAASYAFLYFSVNRADQELTKLEGQINNQFEEEDKKLEKKIKKVQRQLERSEQVINGHRSVYNLLGTLESNTHPQVQFNAMKLSGDLNRVVLKGMTEKFTTLGQQVKAFQEVSSIKDVQVKRTSMRSGGRVGFELNLTLKSDIFKFPPK